MALSQARSVQLVLLRLRFVRGEPRLDVFGVVGIELSLHDFLVRTYGWHMRAVCCRPGDPRPAPGRASASVRRKGDEAPHDKHQLSQVDADGGQVCAAEPCNGIGPALL